LEIKALGLCRDAMYCDGWRIKLNKNVVQPALTTYHLRLILVDNDDDDDDDDDDD